MLLDEPDHYAVGLLGGSARVESLGGALAIAAGEALERGQAVVAFTGLPACYWLVWADQEQLRVTPATRALG